MFQDMRFYLKSASLDSFCFGEGEVQQRNRAAAGPLPTPENIGQEKMVLWLISTAGLRFRFGLGHGFQSLWLHSIMQNMFAMHRLSFGSLSQMFTVPILGPDLHPKDRSPSLVHTFQSGDQSLNPNQLKNPA